MTAMLNVVRPAPRDCLAVPGPLRSAAGLQKREELLVARKQRKLAAILAADVVGYSRLMGHDESGTLTRSMCRRR